MTEAAAVAETHSATVFFSGDRAYKVKKPVDLGFLDFRTREARRAVCHREVELNRRLAPDVYLGVADVSGPDGALCDHMVVMQRMPVDRRLSSLVQADRLAGDDLSKVARAVAMLHERSPHNPRIDRAAGVEHTKSRWAANTNELIAQNARLFGDTAIGLVHGLACRYLDGRSPLFEHRVATGRAVDGHGDLVADDIFCLADGPRILDCVEFDDDLRFGDGLADAAFLAMDLEALGRPDLARRFLNAYAEHRGDVWPSSLEHHHIAYRAQVRAKVTALRAAQGDPEAPAKANSLLHLAASHLHQGRVRLILVGGLPGTGKSTLATHLATQLACTILRSDEIRKELTITPRTRHDPVDFEAGIYAPEVTAATYERMLCRAQVALGMGETVILDASWIDPAWRERARTIATTTYSDLAQLRCDVPAELAATRISARTRNDTSDATPEIAGMMRAIATTWPDAITIDTSVSPADAARAAISSGHIGY